MSPWFSARLILTVAILLQTPAALAAGLTVAVADTGNSNGGGGNGARAANGTVVPLDMLFAEKVERDVDIEAKFPAGYRYYQEQIAKIRAALPPLANDIEKEFAELKWSLSKLPLSGKGSSQQQNTCLNNLGTFRLQKGEKQVVIACQDDRGRVKVDLSEVNSLREPRLMGVVFLHEAIVKRLIATRSGAQYAELENELITEINPYILSSKKLDMKTLFEHALTLGFGSQSMFSPYAQFVDPDGFKAAQDLQERRMARDRLINEMNPLLKILADCEPNDTRINSAEAMIQFMSNSSQKVAEMSKTDALYFAWLMSQSTNVLLLSADRVRMEYEVRNERYTTEMIGNIMAGFARFEKECRAKLGFPKPQ